MLASEETLKQLGKFPKAGKLCQFSHPKLSNIRQQSVKGFKNYLVFYCATEEEVEILRVINGVRDIEAILEDYLDNE